MHTKKSVLSDIWQNTILLVGQTGTLASSFSNMPESWTILGAVGGQTYHRGPWLPSKWPLIHNIITVVITDVFLSLNLVC